MLWPVVQPFLHGGGDVGVDVGDAVVADVGGEGHQLGKKWLEVLVVHQSEDVLDGGDVGAYGVQKMKTDIPGRTEVGLFLFLRDLCLDFEDDV